MIQLILRLFFLIKLTGDFTGYSRSAFPYLLAAKPDQNIFSTDSVPEGFTLSDPDHLNTFKIEALYLNWLRRQKKGLPPFVIINASPQHGVTRKKSQKSAKAKGKEKMEYVEVCSQDESVKENGGEDGEERDDDEVNQMLEEDKEEEEDEKDKDEEDEEEEE